MIPEKIKKALSIIFLLILGMTLTACTSLTAPDVPIDINQESPTIEIPRPSPTVTPEPTLTPTLTPTSQPLTFYKQAPLPDGILQHDLPDDTILSEDPQASFWFGLAENAPPGQALQSAVWVYALAAPFPTLTDDIRLDDLVNIWQGKQDQSLSSFSYLYVPETLVDILEVRWGQHSPEKVLTFSTAPDPELLWEENAWAIIPFDELTPKLKVISVEGVSPLFKDYSPQEDPLALHFALLQNAIVNEQIDQTVQQSMINLITPTNRDTNRITTLVMTGVTALVRQTAYKMEQHGALYPGEKIVHWLAEADLTHISNEVSFYEDCPFPDPAQESLFFCSDPSYIELLDFIGADIIELTGNHNNDMLYARGVDVVPFTIDLYNQHRMAYYGGGLDLDDAKSPLLINHNGNRLAFIGCNAFGPDFAWATEEQGGAAPCEDYGWMVDKITQLKSDGHLPIATFQYYEDYYYAAVDHHIRDYGRMAEAGAVIVNGSQAHHPKAMEFSHDAFIDYGLGNLFFDQKWYIDMYGNVLVQTSWLVIQRHTFYDGRHLSVELLTALLEDFAQPRPMTSDERILFLEELFTASNWNPR